MRVCSSVKSLKFNLMFLSLARVGKKLAVRKEFLTPHYMCKVHVQGKREGEVHKKAIFQQQRTGESHSKCEADPEIVKVVENLKCCVAKILEMCSRVVTN